MGFGEEPRLVVAMFFFRFFHSLDQDDLCSKVASDDLGGLGRMEDDK